MAKKATFRTGVGGSATGDSVDGVDTVDEVDGVDSVDNTPPAPPQAGGEDGVDGETVLEGELGEGRRLPVGEVLEVPLVVRRDFIRDDLKRYQKGDVVAVVQMAPGFDAHSLARHLMDGFLGEAE